MPDARAVWMIPTKVMSWLAMASNLIFRSSSLPLVLWACRMLHAMVPFLAWSIAAASKPSAARAAGAPASAGIHWPCARYAPVLVHSIISFASLSIFLSFAKPPAAAAPAFALFL